MILFLLGEKCDGDVEDGDHFGWNFPSHGTTRFLTYKYKGAYNIKYIDEEGIQMLISISHT